MALQQSSEALRRPIGVLRLFVVLLGIASLAMGYLGMAAYVASRPDLGHRPLDVIYYDLQLFVLGSDPLQAAGPYPALLEIARFTAPAATVYALFEAGRLLFAVEWSRLRARRSRGHAIVCGDTTIADALTQRLQADGVEVIEVRSQVDEFVTAGEPLRVVGDARDPRVLEAAGIAGADAVYVCVAGSADGVAVGLAAARARAEGGTTLSIYSHIADPDLCATFQASVLSRSPGPGVRLDFFHINHIAARRLFADDPLEPVQGRPPRVMVAGANGFGSAVVVEAVRTWRIVREGAQALPLVVVDDNASAAMANLQQRYPFLTTDCAGSAEGSELLELLTTGAGLIPPDWLLICHDDEEQALKTAMAAERVWRGKVSRIVVRLDGLAHFLDGYGRSDASFVLDAGAGLIRPFGVIGAACDPQLIREDLIERLAHAIHDHYRRGRRERGEWSSDDPSLAAWDELPPLLQSQNRAQAADIGRKLAAVNCGISPRFGSAGDLVLSASDLDRVAELEHERWREEHVRAGWQYGPDWSGEDKRHPGLCSWASLPEEFRRRTQDAVRELTTILADVGFKIVRG